MVIAKGSGGGRGIEGINGEGRKIKNLIKILKRKKED